jgi:hypothetical protein
MLRSSLVLILLAACGGTRYRTERIDLVGHGNGTLSTDVSAAPGAGGVQLPQGNYELAMRFDVPRAQVVEWKIICPGVDLDGQVGESLERYRERRVAELARERENEAARAETAINIVAGSIARVELHAGGPITLAPDDIGRGTLVSTARVMTAGDGVCALEVNAPDPEVRASFTVTRIRDLDAEQRMRTIAARESAVKARGTLSAQLVTAGANPELAPARVASDQRARAETQAIFARQEYILYLTGKCNADPNRDERADEAARVRREARLNSYLAIAEQRDQAALRARDHMRAQLLALGAKQRPPMPPPRPEEPGTPPSDDAQWTAGYWSWESGDWAWHDGSWMDPDEFDYGYYAPDVANVRKHEDDNYVAPLPGVRDHRRLREHKRDHRETSESSRSWLGGAADKVSNKSSNDDAKVRDHRGDDRRVWVPKDADDKKKDDDKPIVRDHRR